MASGTDFELGNAVAEYQQADADDQRVVSLKKVSSQVKHKALAEPTAISIIGLVTEAVSYRGEVRDAALALLAYLVRRIHSQGQLSSSKIAAALNEIPNWPDTLNDLRKRGVPQEVRFQLQEALERPPPAGSTSSKAVPAEQRPMSRPGVERRMAPHAAGSRPASSGSGAGKEALTSSTNTLTAPPDNGLDPIYVSSASQLDHLCRDMLPDFEGKESEGNWPRRDKNITKLRQITKGNAPTDFTAAYIINWKTLLEGILKSATSLRTTFSTNACQLIQEGAAAVGHGLDVYAGRILEATVKMCSDTKPIAAQNGNNCVLALITHVSWNKHILQYVSDTCKDKNVKPREFSYGWLKAALTVYAQRKNVLEQANGLDTIEKCFRQGIGDPNPKVRETAKKVFWDFHAVWPARGAAIISSLDERAQKSLNATNPATSGGAASTFAPSAAGPAKARAVNARPSIKDIMAAKRREKVTDRPQSALANLQTVETKPAKKPAVSNPHSRSAADHATGGISSAPVRPGRKVVSRQVSRPEGLNNVEPDRPKTPFRSAAARRPESRAEEKRQEGPRRLGVASSKAPAASSRPVPIKKSIAPSSLPASPEKERGSPSHRRPKSIAEDSPVSIRGANLNDPPPHMGTPPSAVRRFRREGSPLHSISTASRMSTPARVYEDPRSSPSMSPQSIGGNMALRGPRDVVESSSDHTASTVNITPTTRLAPPGDATVNLGESFSPIKMPLMELSSNEVNSPLATNKKDTRSVKLIDSGIVHMKSGKLDPYGYRKLHDAVVANLDALSAEKFHELLFGALKAPATGQENASGSNPAISSERILVQRLHLLSALAKSDQIQQYLAPVLRLLVHTLRHDARQESHTYWVAEGMLKEFAQITCATPNETARGVLEQPQEQLNAVVLKCVALLVQNRAFDKGDGELISTVAELASEAIASQKDVDARIQGHQLAQALGSDAIKRFLGDSGVAFMLYQNMKAGA